MVAWGMPQYRLPVVSEPKPAPARDGDLRTDPEASRLPFVGLDTLWLQLTGTLCNIACRHCFITCGPKETRVPMMSMGRIDALLDESVTLGVKEYYLTGGEPMLHPAFFEVIERLLRLGPVHVLTNGMLIDAGAATRLRQAFDGTRYALELRVSLDGTTAEENNAVRGKGTFEATLAGLSALAKVKLSPVITVVEHSETLRTAEAREGFLAFARSLGFAQGRIKFLPLLRIGREQRRTYGYGADESVTGTLPDEVLRSLQCNSSRMATEEDVFPCPLLLDAPTARMGRRLAEATRDIRLQWAACTTCVQEGLSCRT